MAIINTSANLQVNQSARAIFFGTPDFALPTLDAVFELQHVVDLALVVTAPDAPVGRHRILTPPLVKVWAQKHNVPVLQPENLTDAVFLGSIAARQPDVGIMAAYGKILPKTLLDLFPKGILNVHPSLLPRWRGPSPIQSAIAAGDRETGVTVLLIDEQMDHGPILAQESHPLPSDANGVDLTAFLAKRGADLLKRVLVLWLTGEISPKPQDERLATFSTMLKRDDGHIRWSAPADEIERLVRAYNVWPGTYAVLPNSLRLKVLGARKLIDSSGNGTIPGTVRENEQGALCVRALDGWVELTTVQLEGGVSMDGASFLRGHRDLIDQQLL